MDTNFVAEMINAFNLVMGSDINQEMKATFLSHWNTVLDERINNPDSGRYELGEDEHEETPYDWDWCYFDSHDDALECLQACMHRAEICKGGYCEVASYYDNAGEYEKIKYSDWDHGWTLDDLKKAEIFECPKRRNKKWTIKFPEARRIEDHKVEVKSVRFTTKPLAEEFKQKVINRIKDLHMTFVPLYQYYDVYNTTYDETDWDTIKYGWNLDEFEAANLSQKGFNNSWIIDLPEVHEED